jgi:CrcB protein
LFATHSRLRRFSAVLCGGFLGTIVRYWLSILVQSYLGKGWPYDILLINISGALILAFVTVLADTTFLIGPTRRLFVNIGFLGAYTTFSSLELGAITLFMNGNWILALLYLIASFGGGVLAVLLGEWLAQTFIRALKRSPTYKIGKLSSHVSTEPAQNEKDHSDIQDDLLAR